MIEPELLRIYFPLRPPFSAHMEHENYIRKRSENIRKQKRLTENPAVGGQIFATSTCLLTGRSRLPPAPYFNVDTRIQR